MLGDVRAVGQLEAPGPAFSAAPGTMLFAPRTAIRVRGDENQDTPLPPEVPAGKNPPDGAILNYLLPANSSGDIQLEIYDADEKLVRSFSSMTAPKEPEETPFVAEYWIGHPQPLSKAPGIHPLTPNFPFAHPPPTQPHHPTN